MSCGTIFLCFYAQVTWHHVEHPIRLLKQSRRSSLKSGGGGGYVARNDSSVNRFRKWFNLRRSSEEL